MTLEEIKIAAVGLISVSAALYAVFKGRAKWEPHSQDIPKGSQRIAALGSSVCIVLIVFFFSTKSSTPVVVCLLLLAFVGVLLSFWDYHYLTSALIYEKHDVIEGEPTTIKVLIAKKRDLEPGAKQYLSNNPNATIQDLINSCGGDLDKVWNPDARARMRRRYEWDYILLMICGTTALACGGILAVHL